MVKSKLYFITLLFISLTGFSQVNVLSFSEYIGYVKKFHPIVKQADLTIEKAQTELMQARGFFDPKLEVDYEQKTFKDSQYFEKLNATFKIPTWYGIEVKANFEDNMGNFLNPEATVPSNGLYSVGVSASLAQGLLINKRMAAIKQAKLFKKQTAADRNLLVTSILANAADAYFNWYRQYQELLVYDRFLKNADIRFKGIKRSVETGNKPAIDSIEARVSLNNRKLNLVKARVSFRNASLELSNFLWFDDRTPLEVKENLTPENISATSIDEVLKIDVNDSFVINNHPKLLSLGYEIENLQVERRLKMNNLLPKIDVQYNFLTQTPENLNSYSNASYKAGVNVSFPLFLRKERGGLKFTKLKIQDKEYKLGLTRLSLENKISAINQELNAFTDQNELMTILVSDYEKMLKAEERRFELGESSVFLINSRESKLIEIQLKSIELENKFYSTKTKLFNTLANPQ